MMDTAKPTSCPPQWTIARPPLAKTFGLPPRKVLLSLVAGDLVKLMFHHLTVGRMCAGERMWVRITNCNGIECWQGVLDDDPECVNPLEPGDSVLFHPYDIVDIVTAKQADALRQAMGAPTKS